MPKLTDTAVKGAKSGEKPRKLMDEKGLFLLVNPKGSRLWRFRYRFNDKEKLLALGSYPLVTLADARRKRDDARKLLDQGLNPSTERKDKKLAAKVANA